MNSLAVIFAATGRDTVSQWLRVDLVAIVMIISGAHVLMRLVAFIADQQILSVKNRNPDSSDLSALSTGAHRAAVLGGKQPPAAAQLAQVGSARVLRRGAGGGQGSVRAVPLQGQASRGVR